MCFQQLNQNEFVKSFANHTSAVQIDVCDQKQIIPIIKYLSAVSESEITVEQSNNGLQFHVSRPSDIYRFSIAS
jgi:hypothetical protein